jgi:hypothetical protein
VSELVVHHHPSPRRDGTRRRRQLLRNALWFAWLRRPVFSAVRKTMKLARSAPWDRATLGAFAAAFAGLPGKLPARRVVPPAVERGLHLLDLAADRGEQHAARS